MSVFWCVLEERAAVLAALELLFLRCGVGCVKCELMASQSSALREESLRTDESCDWRPLLHVLDCGERVAVEREVCVEVGVGESGDASRARFFDLAPRSSVLLEACAAVGGSTELPDES